MITYYITQRRVREIHHAEMWKGGSELVKFDYKAWAEDNGDVTAVTWSLEAGQAAIASESLTSNVAQAQITTANEGWALIKILATSGSDLNVQWLEIKVKDPDREPLDYV